MDERAVFNAVMRVVQSGENERSPEEIIELAGNEIIKYLDSDLKVEGFRVYERSNNHFVLKKQIGKKGEARAGHFKIDVDYAPIKELLESNNNYIIRLSGENGVNKHLEDALGVKSFAVSKIGEASNYLLAFSIPDHVSNAKKEELSFFMYTLSNTLSTKLKEHQLEDIINDASRLQMSLKPKKPLNLKNYDLDYAMIEAESVGGDYVHFQDLGDIIVLGIADASGHGMDSAALVRGLSKGLYALSDFGHAGQVKKIVETSNRLIYSDALTDKFVTLFYAALDDESGRIVYSNAGHNPPLILRNKTGEFEELLEGGMPLGILENPKYEIGSTILGKGDILIMYTDGIIDMPGRKEETFGLEGLKQAVIEDKHKEIFYLTAKIIERSKSFRSVKDILYDDMTVFMVKRK